MVARLSPAPVNVVTGLVMTGGAAAFFLTVKTRVQPVASYVDPSELVRVRPNDASSPFCTVTVPAVISYALR